MHVGSGLDKRWIEVSFSGEPAKQLSALTEAKTTRPLEELRPEFQLVWYMWIELGRMVKKRGGNSHQVQKEQSTDMKNKTRMEYKSARCSKVGFGTGWWVPMCKAKSLSPFAEYPFDDVPESQSPFEKEGEKST